MWRRILGPFQEFGWVAGTLYTLDRALRRLSPHLGLFVYDITLQPISGAPRLPPNLRKNLRFSEILPGDPEVARMPARVDIKALRFTQGARCLGVYRRDSLLGYIWVCFRQYDEDEVRCTYELVAPECSVFDFDLYILPEHRLGIAFMAIWDAANQYLSERKVRYTFSRVTRFNLTSRRSHAHLGSRLVGRALFFQAWTLELMLATLEPYIALTWKPGQRVHMRLSPDVPGGAMTTMPPDSGSGQPDRCAD